MPRLIAIALALLCPLAALATAAPLRVVAAENFYGDIASQIAGPRAEVRSVLSNPDADPHLFEVDVDTARAVTDADLVVYNGLHYDTWMTRLLSGTRSPRRVVVEAAAAARAAPGSNPHLWYDPAAMQAVARALALQFAAIDPSHRALYEQRLATFLASMRPFSAEIARIRSRYAGVTVAATEPVADYLVAALGLTMRERRFQLAVMNDTEPSARDTAAFEQDLRRHRVRALIYNRQATSTSVERLLGIARQAGVPIVAVTETEPAGRSYQQWMLGELGELGRALASASSQTALAPRTASPARSTSPPGTGPPP
ncbi:MAG: metal ABC transporter solute-binding protein, Zn/Mn family [Steroidobacteraceae bacterium]